ncbi:MAG: hypothetical protein AAF387_07525 [Pseudomonadota bacterium]
MASSGIIRYVLIGLACLIVGGAYAVIHEVTELRTIETYNKAIHKQDYDTASRVKLPSGKFVTAFQMQQGADYQTARLQYEEVVSLHASPQLTEDSLFNQANTYLQQALSVDMETEADIATPLVELAKIAYRELLAINPNYVDAKYNLERALQLSPDSRALPPVEIPGRRNPNRTVISIDPEDSLP